VAAQHLGGVGEARRVGHRGTAGNRAEVIADDVREDQGAELGRRGEPGQTAALEQREVLAHAVDLIDVGAAGEQQFGGLYLLGERDRRGRIGQQGRAAAADESQHQIARSRRLGELGDPPGAGQAAFVGQGMAGGDDLAIGQAAQVFVVGDH
jgi:hypothetical protein